MSAERQQLLPPELVLQYMPIRVGSIVADIGAGPGYFTLPIAEHVGPTGVVYASDVAPEMIQLLESQPHPAWVRIVAMDGESIPLPDASVDSALVAFVLHEIDDGTAFLREVARTLKADGSLTIVEWLRQVETSGPPLEERLTPDDTISMLQRADYRVDPTVILNASHYLISACPVRVNEEGEDVSSRTPRFRLRH